jgi:hypothetical protein
LETLVQIPDKYDVAISTACGGGLNNMVVDQVEQAQTCIESQFSEYGPGTNARKCSRFGETQVVFGGAKRWRVVTLD